MREKPNENAMTSVDAYVNDGRWLVRCPICHQASQIKPKEGKVYFVCGACYPEKIKRVPKASVNGKIQFGYSRDLQKRAKSKAYRDNRVFIVNLPEDWKAAEKVLRNRMVRHQHYLPWKESLRDLEKENLSDPELHYLWADSERTPEASSEAQAEEAQDEQPAPRKELDPDFMRKIQ